MYHRGAVSKGGAYSRLLLGRHPFARAELSGSLAYADIRGTVEFFSTPLGVVVCTEVSGLPYDKDACTASQIYGMHIHNTGKCTGGEGAPFSDAGEHFDTSGLPHPYHSGDLPTLFGNNGYAWGAVLTNRFTPEDIIGRAVIIHRDADDMKTQPSGASGERVACGAITRIGY